MTLAEIKGNRNLVKALTGMVESGHIPHALLFSENDGCGAFALVQAFLDELFAHDHKVSGMIHPDVRYVFPIVGGTSQAHERPKVTSETFLDKFRDLASGNPYFTEEEYNLALGFEKKSTSISVGEARVLLDKLALTPVEGGWNAVVFYLPEKMNAAAANTLLKVLEEPSDKILFLMITHATEKVLPTITSRCQGLRVLPYSREEITEILTGQFGKSEDEAARAALRADGSVGEALRFLSDREDYKAQTELFSNLINALISKDLIPALACADTMAALPSREKQKAFCKFAVENLRKIFLLQQGLRELAGLSAEERAFFTMAADRCKKSFPRKAMAVFDRAQLLIDRNVNQKILFCDLVNRLYENI